MKDKIFWFKVIYNGMKSRICTTGINKEDAKKKLIKALNKDSEVFDD